MNRLKDYLKLHVVILLWGTTAALGNLIDLSATQLVLIRSFFAATILLVWLRGRASISPGLALALVANGMLLGFHWVLFFLSVKMANVSICMVGMATVSFWTAILEPLMLPAKRFRGINVVLGVVVIGGVYLIYRTDSQFETGLFVALTAALVACIFSVINGQFSGKADDDVIVMYEMAGAGTFCALAIPLGRLFGWELASDRWLPTPMEWVWLAILVVLCTIYAYRMYVQLLKRLSVYTINFANNLEPVYGILLGALVFGDHRYVSGGFYVGTAIIAASVLAQPFFAEENHATERKAIDSDNSS